MARDYSKAAAKWAARVAQSGQSWLDGVQATDVSPSEMAIAQQGKLLANFTNSVTSGRWANGLRAWPRDRWAAQTVSVGAGKYTAGAAKGKPKLDAYFQAAAPTYTQARSLRNSQDDAMTRMNKNLALMQTLKGINKRGAF
jgi:hypothetical protein